MKMDDLSRASDVSEYVPRKLLEWCGLAPDSRTSGHGECIYDGQDALYARRRLRSAKRLSWLNASSIRRTAAVGTCIYHSSPKRLWRFPEHHPLHCLTEIMSAEQCEAKQPGQREQRSASPENGLNAYHIYEPPAQRKR